MTTGTQLAKQEQKTGGVRRASEILAEHLGMEPHKMIAVIKAQCFKGTRPEAISDEQLAAYINVANALQTQAPNFNPLVSGMLYAFPSKNGGIEPMIGPEGIYALLSSRRDVEGWRTELETDEAGNIIAATATIYVTGKRPFIKRCLFREWNVGTNANWNSRPAHMIEWRALKQCARQVIHGIPLDEDELAWMRAAEKRGVVDVEYSGATRTEQLARMISGPVPVSESDGEQEQPEVEEKPRSRRKTEQAEPETGDALFTNDTEEATK